MNREERGAMIKVILFSIMMLMGLYLLFDCSSARGNTPPTHPPVHKSAKILQLEKQLQITFIEVERSTLADGSVMLAWGWSTQTPTSTGKIWFCSPVDASFETVKWCCLSAIYCAGYVDEWYAEKIQEMPKTDNPRSEPTPAPQSVITHT